MITKMLEIESIRMRKNRMAKSNKNLFVSQFDLQFRNELRGFADLGRTVLKLLKY